ncbi:MAG: alpha/beta hydrolase [Rhodobacterales bacterium]|nr:alpha/beta hydrolase [Rhodobacterales bacterium]NCT13409.1 alpha/beta hydrolase [Rhodobacterales bacterium]
MTDQTRDLSDDYANGAHIPGGADYPARWARDAAAFRDHVAVQTGLAYGPGPRETFDLVLPGGAPRGTVVFVHGGYWMEGSPDLWTHLAAGPLARGWAVALPGYALCPEVRITQIVAQVARAVEAVGARVAGPLVLTGHSAGGHLVARLGCDDVALGLRERVARIVPISPIANLAPLLCTGMNAVLRLDPAEAAAQSPLLRPAPRVPVTVRVGADERPAFLQQADWLARGWGVGCDVVPGRHHFDVIDALAVPQSGLCDLLCGS